MQQTCQKKCKSRLIQPQIFCSLRFCAKRCHRFFKKRFLLPSAKLEKFPQKHIYCSEMVNRTRFFVKKIFSTFQKRFSDQLPRLRLANPRPMALLSSFSVGYLWTLKAKLETFLPPPFRDQPKLLSPAFSLPSEIFVPQEKKIFCASRLERKKTKC